MFKDFTEETGNTAEWEAIFCANAWAGCTRESAPSDDNKETTLGFMKAFTHQTVASLFMKELDWVPNINRLLTVKYEDLERLLWKHVEHEVLVALSSPLTPRLRWFPVASAQCANTPSPTPCRAHLGLAVTRLPTTCCGGRIYSI